MTIEEQKPPLSPENQTPDPPQAADRSADDALDELSGKLKALRPQKTLKGEEGEDQDTPNPFAAAYRLGIELVVGLVVGALLGNFVDRLAGTKPVFLIVFLFLGFGAALRNIFRNIQKLDDDNA